LCPGLARETIGAYWAGDLENKLRIVGGGVIRRGSGFVFGVLGMLGASALPAPGQSQPDYSAANPRQLVRAWQGAGRGERSAIAAAMVARREQVLPTLRETARSGDRADKIFACSMIAEMRDRDGVAALLDATNDGDVKVRRRAATALRILADSRSASRLREIVRSETDLGVAKTAVAALGGLGQRRDRALIEPLLAHGDYEMRLTAAAALAMLGEEVGLDLVLDATFADDPAAQKTATYALGFFSAGAAGERLAAILSDPNGAWKS
jgi:hypothetical protein